MTDEMSDDEVWAFAVELDLWMHDKGWFKRSQRELRRQLRWRTRLRLRRDDLSNHIGFWLCDHRMWRAAEVLWRIRT